MSIKVGKCFKSNADPDADTEEKCLDPCNQPTQPTINCPNGGRPRFEGWDYVSGNVFYSPECQKKAEIVICSGYLDKFPVGSRVTIYDSGKPIGSYLVLAHKPPDTLVIRNTGNAPNGVTFHSPGNFRIISGNHDGHWNDAECKNRPLANNGNIILARPTIGVEDACGCEEEAKCFCEAELPISQGFLRAIPTPDGLRYEFTENVAEQNLCNEQMPVAPTADYIFGKKSGGCGVKLQPSAAGQYIQSTESGVLFSPLSICSVPEGDFSLEESTVLQCRDGQTTRANILSALGAYLESNDIKSPCLYPDGGTSQQGDKILACRNGQAVKVNNDLSPHAAVTLDVDFTSVSLPHTIINQRNLSSILIAPNSPPSSGTLVIDFFNGGVPNGNFILLHIIDPDVTLQASLPAPPGIYRATFKITDPGNPHPLRIWVMIFRIQ